MERIEAHILRGPRAYFTNFDYRIVRRTRNRDKLRRDVERRLKILLLTKDVVVCAASHLTSRFAYELFRNNPILLNKGLMVPALRRDRSDISALFSQTTMPSPLKREMIRFYSSQVPKAVNWELEENAPWFRDSFLAELKTPNSVLRKNLTRLTGRQLRSITADIEKDRILDRGKVDSIARSLDRRDRRAILNFRELLYHMSGARVVNCESTLPQENYIDYSLADMQHRKILLSETQIFWKIFLELAFETMQKMPVPLALIDTLSFEDICALRSPIEKSSFRDTYDALVRQSVMSVRKDNPDTILYDVHQLLSMRDTISKAFESIFQEELSSLMRRKALEDAKALAKNTLSIGLGVAGLVPPMSTFAGVGSLLLESPAFYVNLSHTFRSLRSLSDYDRYVKDKEAALRSVIMRSQIEEKSALLDVVNMLTDMIGTKIAS